MLHVDRRDGTERQVIIAMIFARSILGPIAARWQPNLFPSHHCNLIANWCVEHYNKFHRAPSRQILSYFEEWASSAERDRDTVRVVESLLSGLEDDYERVKESTSPDFLIDCAAKLFRRRQLSDLSSRIASALEMGDVDKAESLVAAHRKIELGLGSGIDVLDDDAAMEAVFDPERVEQLVEYPDAGVPRSGAYEFFRNALCRGRFVAFMGKNKVGKSFWLADLAWRAIEQRRRVAFFEVGDQTQSDVLARFASRWCDRPLEAKSFEVPVTLSRPESDDDKRRARVQWEWREYREPLTADEEREHRRRWADRVGRTRFKLSCHANSSVSVGDLMSILEGWDRDGWRPDVIVVDYADILAPMNPKDEERSQIDLTWRTLRSLSQRLHCLVVTATQADTESFGTYTLTRRNFTGDRRKLDHVSGMVGINQVQSEKTDRVYRLNWIVRRDLTFDDSVPLWCAAALDIANPCVLSTF